MTEPRTAATRTCAFRLEPGLLVARFLEGAEVGVEDARANLRATGGLFGETPGPVLVDLRALKSQSPGARAVLAGPAAARVSTAVALLIGSPLSRVVGNFYLRFNRPETPTRLFSDEAEARAWLASLPAARAGPRDGTAEPGGGGDARR